MSNFDWLNADDRPSRAETTPTAEMFLRQRDALAADNARLREDNRLLAGAMRRWEVHVGAGYLPAIGEDATLAYDRALDA